MESMLSTETSVLLLYTALAVFAIAVVVLTGCGIARGIRGSGACSFFWQDEGKERGRMS